MRRMVNMAKKDKKINSSVKTDQSDKKGGGILFAIVSLLSAILVIAAVLAGFIFVVVKTNTFGVADAYKDSIANIPVLKMALPKEEKTDPAEMTVGELTALYDTKLADNENLTAELNDANKRIEELSKAKSELDAQIMVHSEKADQLMKQVLALEANKKQLEDMKYDLDRIVAAGDGAAFSKYYEGVSPEIAQEIYAQIIQKREADDEKKQFIKLFGTLDTKASAKIIETLGSGRIEFISDTLNSLKKDVAADIIANLTPELAAQITLRLSGN